MENKNLIDISIKYGFDSPQVSKLVDIAYQAGVQDIDSREFLRLANYIGDMELIDMPSEELIQELKLKGLMQD